jgi:hypothetical protein
VLLIAPDQTGHSRIQLGHQAGEFIGGARRELAYGLRILKRTGPPTAAASLAPVMLSTFAFEHAHGLAGAGIEDLTDEAWHRLATRAGRFGLGHLQ